MEYRQGGIKMRVCDNCGKELKKGAAFCIYCGTKIEEEVEYQESESYQNDENYQEEVRQQDEARHQEKVRYREEANDQERSGYRHTEARGARKYNDEYYEYNNRRRQKYAPAKDYYDHTDEFDPIDISDNKVIAMLIYLMGTFGIIIALLASHTSPYVGFHVRQSLKFTVLSMLAGIIALLFCWTIVVPIVVLIFCVALIVVKFICFFSICNGKAKEPPIIRLFGFLR